eukprot:XP_011661971.1 PREDICTED: WD repeat-containing protein 41-like [Strongylocentrotus purpuratus]
MQNQVEILQDDQPLNPYTEIQILHDHTDLIKFLLPISENKFLSVSDDNTGIIWDVTTGLKLCTLVGHTRPITCASLMRPPVDDESREVEMSHYLLLTGSSDRTIRVWSTENGACLQIITEHNATTKAILSFPNNGLFCTGGQDLFLWNSDGRLLQTIKQEAEDVSDCPLADIKHMLAVCEDRFVVAAGSALEVYGIEAQIGQLGVTSFQMRRVKKLVPQHREAVMCLTRISDSYFASASLDGTVKVWNSHTLSTSRQLNHINEYEKNGFPWCVQHLIPLDTKHLCITIGSGLAVFDIVTGDCLWKQANAHFSKITFISIINDGRFLATCSEDGTIRLWGVDQRIRGGSEDGDNSAKDLSMHKFTDIVQAREGKKRKEKNSYFASASLDGTVKVWNSHTLSTSRQLNHINEYEKNGFPWCVQHLIPLDTKHLCITIGSGLAVFDIVTGDCLWKKAHAHFSKITFISIINDGRFLATCSEDGTIRLWGVDQRIRGGSEDGDNSAKDLSMHKFTDIVQASHQKHSKESRRLFRREESRPPLLCLQGECVAHSGAVQMILDFRHDGMASCGVDGLVILWKDGELENAKRSDLIREMLQAKNGLL